MKSATARPLNPDVQVVCLTSLPSDTDSAEEEPLIFPKSGSEAAIGLPIECGPRAKRLVCGLTRMSACGAMVTLTFDMAPRGRIRPDSLHTS